MGTPTNVTVKHNPLKRTEPDLLGDSSPYNPVQDLQRLINQNKCQTSKVQSSVLLSIKAQ